MSKSFAELKNTAEQLDREPNSIDRCAIGLDFICNTLAKVSVEQASSSFGTLSSADVARHTALVRAGIANFLADNWKIVLPADRLDEFNDWVATLRKSVSEFEVTAAAIISAHKQFETLRSEVN
jgi:hypothetical protein